MAAPRFASLTTERLTLRRFVARDLPAHLALRGDPGTRRFQSYARHYGGLQALSFFHAMRGRDPDDGRGWFNLCIAARGDGTPLGDLGVSRTASRAMLGISLAPAARGRGYATEALQAVIAWLAARGLTALRAEIDARNGKSIALFQDRLAFAPLGRYCDGKLEVLVYERPVAA